MFFHKIRVLLRYRSYFEITEFILIPTRGLRERKKSSLASSADSIRCIKIITMASADDNNALLPMPSLPPPHTGGTQPMQNFGGGGQNCPALCPDLQQYHGASQSEVPENEFGSISLFSRLFPERLSSGTPYVHTYGRNRYERFSKGAFFKASYEFNPNCAPGTFLTLFLRT